MKVGKWIPPTVVLLTLLGAALAADEQLPKKWDLDSLVTAYRTQPQDYPAGKEYARPDTSVFFRWHWFNGDVQRFDDAQMAIQADLFNPLEGNGVKADGPKTSFVAEHVTEGKQALKVDFSAADIQGGKNVAIEAVSGPGLNPLAGYDVTCKAVSYGTHYRRVALDVFNPAQTDVRINVMTVPMVLHPGANVVAVRTVDMAGATMDGDSIFNRIIIKVAGPAQDVSLFIDNVRMEAEKPGMISAKGKLFQFTVKTDDKNVPKVHPGFSAVVEDTEYTKERGFGWSAASGARGQNNIQYSQDHSLLKGGFSGINAPFRVDLPNGSYGVCIFVGASDCAGLKAKINGTEQTLLDARDKKAIDQIEYATDTTDYRPGQSVFMTRIRDRFHPQCNILQGDVTDGKLMIDLPRDVTVSALMIFPMAEKAEALKEVGRLYFLLAESFDLSRFWVKKERAAEQRYVGRHEEMMKPEKVPEKLKALNLKPEDFKRGFVVFRTGLEEMIFPDSIPSPQDVPVKEMRCSAAPGRRECMTLGVLPLAVTKDVKVAVGDLVSKDGGKISSGSIDVLFSCYQPKMSVWRAHGTPDYNYSEHFLIHRDSVMLEPVNARRIYVDVNVPAGTKAGEYSGQIGVSAGGAVAVSVPVVVEVMPVVLGEPPVYFAAQAHDPFLQDVGFNTFQSGNYDEAVKLKLKGAYSLCGSNAKKPSWGSAIPRINGKDYAWNDLLPAKDVIQPIMKAGRDGSGPRIFAGGSGPGTYKKKSAEVRAIVDPLFKQLSAELPELDILNFTTPLYTIEGSWYANDVGPFDNGSENSGMNKDVLGKITAASTAGKDFWFLDSVGNSKEQGGRFTFGFWLWCSKATGRYSSIVKSASGNILTPRDNPVMRAPDGTVIISRDLLLMREGIDDYRYVYALEKLVKQATEKKAGGAAVDAAGKFLDELRNQLSLDLKTYYELRPCAYHDNWYVLAGNPWTSEKFDGVRHKCAEHIVAVGK